MNSFFILGIVIAVIIALVLLVFIANFFCLWLQALFSKANVGNIPAYRNAPSQSNQPKIIVDARILSCKAGMPVVTNLLEAHFMSGGNVLRVIQAHIAANKANIKLDFKEATAI
jgi:uncharacterized protein YqfA (UPF0365 family)